MRYTTTTSLMIICMVFRLGASASRTVIKTRLANGNQVPMQIEMKNGTKLNVKKSSVEDDGKFVTIDGSAKYQITFVKLTKNGNKIRITCIRLDEDCKTEKDATSQFYVNIKWEEGQNFLEWIRKCIEGKAFRVGNGAELIKKYSRANNDLLGLPMDMCKPEKCRWIQRSKLILNFNDKDELKDLNVQLIKPGKLMKCFDGWKPKDNAEIISICNPKFDGNDSHFTLKVKSGTNTLERQIYPYRNMRTTTNVKRFLRAVLQYEKDYQKKIFSHEMKNTWKGRALCRIMGVMMGVAIMDDDHYSVVPTDTHRLPTRAGLRNRRSSNSNY